MLFNNNFSRFVANFYDVEAGSAVDVAFASCNKSTRCVVNVCKSLAFNNDFALSTENNHVVLSFDAFNRRIFDCKLILCDVCVRHVLIDVDRIVRSRLNIQVVSVESVVFVQHVGTVFLRLGIFCRNANVLVGILVGRSCLYLKFCNSETVGIV